MHTFPSRSGVGSGAAASLLSLAVAAAAAALPVGTAKAATVWVANCKDSGAGSLRDAVARARTGDAVDLRRLACKRIDLTSGPVRIAQRDLTLVGPGRSRLVLDGNGGTVLVHDYVTFQPPFGTLVVQALRITNRGTAGGQDPRPAGSRCINAYGNLRLIGVEVHHCNGGGVSAAEVLQLAYSHVHSNVTSGEGGGAYAITLTAHHSRISNNTARYGGGIRAGEAHLNYSTLDGNHSLSGPTRDEMGIGGGVWVMGGAVFNKSTVSNNSAALGGGFYGREIYVYDSTFSGNVAHSGSAMHSRGTVFMANSTVAFNRVQTTYPTTEGAITMSSLWDTPAPGDPPTYRIASSIIAGNLTNGAPGNDFGPDFSYVYGRNNLIERSPIRVPADTISAFPRLAPLADNGGPTWTHAPLGDSPAIDRGANVRNRQYDQRGPGFLRTRGAALDIGAVESGN